MRKFFQNIEDSPMIIHLPDTKYLFLKKLFNNIYKKNGEIYFDSFFLSLTETYQEHPEEVKPEENTDYKIEDDLHLDYFIEDDPRYDEEKQSKESYNFSNPTDLQPSNISENLGEPSKDRRTLHI